MITIISGLCHQRPHPADKTGEIGIGPITAAFSKYLHFYDPATLRCQLPDCPPNRKHCVGRAQRASALLGLKAR